MLALLNRNKRTESAKQQQPQQHRHERQHSLRQRSPRPRSTSKRQSQYHKRPTPHDNNNVLQVNVDSPQSMRRIDYINVESSRNVPHNAYNNYARQPEPATHSGTNCQSYREYHSPPTCTSSSNGHSQNGEHHANDSHGSHSHGGGQSHAAAPSRHYEYGKPSKYGNK